MSAASLCRERIKAAVLRRLNRLVDQVVARPPDQIIGGHTRPYLLRWVLLPRNRIANVYVHRFLRDDDDRALHDHPWFWCSILIRGRYVEHTIARGGIHRRRECGAGSWRLRTPWFAHRIELVDTDPCWTLFITVARIRDWGFHCPSGWVPWQEFTDPRDPGAIGRGCDQ